MEFVQVLVRTNLAPSVPYVDRSRAADGVIRLLRGETAIISKRASAFYGERLRSLVRGASSLLRGVIAGYSFLCSGRIPYHIGDGTTFTGFSSPFIRQIDDPFAVSGNSNDRP